MSIDTYTSHEEGTIRSIRGTDHIAHRHSCETPQESLLREIEQFRNAAIEQIQRSVENVVESVASEVLARNAAVSTSELQSLIARALRTYQRESPIRLRVAAKDVAHAQTDLPVIADYHLESGNIVLELRDGAEPTQLPVPLSCSAGRLQKPVVTG